MTLEPDSVTLETARKLLGGEEPYSEATVRRMIRDGALAAYGKGQLLRIDVGSINDYKAGRRKWQRSVCRDAARAGLERSRNKAMARTSPARQTDPEAVDFPLDRKATGKQKKP